MCVVSFQIVNHILVKKKKPTQLHKLVDFIQLCTDSIWNIQLQNKYI